MDSFVGLTWLDDSLIFPSPAVKESLVQLIYSELHKYFNEQFIRTYDRQKHYFYFTLDVEFEEDSCKLISCEVSKEEKKKEKIPFVDGQEHGLQFILKTIPDKNKENQILVRYNPNGAIYTNHSFVNPFVVGEDNAEEARDVAISVMIDCLAMVEKRMVVFITHRELDNFAKSLGEKINTTICSGDQKESHVYFFDIIAKFHREYVEITSCKAIDLVNDDLQTIPFLNNIVTIPREKFLENDPFEWSPPNLEAF